jgi:small subunit ribosomal protein S6
LARHYETIFILHPNETDESVSAAVTRIKGIIEKHSGQFIKEDNWGVREMAYPIQKVKRGRYIMLAYKANTSVVGELEQNFNVMENIIKYLNVKLSPAHAASYEKKPEPPKEAAAPAEGAATPSEA